MKNIISPFITRTRLIAVLTVTCFSLALSGAQAGDGARAENVTPDRGKFLLISFDENFTGDTTIDGTSTISGAFSDLGSRHEDFTTAQQGDEVIVTGTVTITGGQGTLITQFVGAIPANGDSPNYISGVESVVSGTGIYAGLHGKGTFEATLDFDTGNIVGVVELKVH